MPDTLFFRFRLKRGAAFTLDVEERVPLTGITAISGASGSGKTTLLRGLAGLDPEVTGERAVRFSGKVWDDETVNLTPEDRRVGMVFQEPALFPHLSIGDNIGYGARRRGVASTDAIVEALDLGPMMSRGVTGLSGGEARRVALARALASDPAIILLDEPMTGLDAKRRADFLPYIARAVSAARVPAIYVTHSLEEITTLADRVLLLSGGRSSGWQTPPMRLVGKVIGPASGGMTVRIDKTADADVTSELTLPLRAFSGEKIGLGLIPENIHLSANHPGSGSALAVLPTTVVKKDGTDTKTLNVLGQELVLPPALAMPADCEHPWLSILRAYPRPQPSDSTT